MNKLSELKAAAMDATPGPWIVGAEDRMENGNLYGIYVSNPGDDGCEDGRILECFSNCLVTTDADVRANAEFIAAANPAAVLELLAERDADKKRITELEAIATDYADKFQKAQDAAKHLIIMNDKDKKRITELDRSETQLIDERDSAHAALDDMYEAVTGKRPEWSNWFGFADAIEEVELIAAGFTSEGNGQ